MKKVLAAILCAALFTSMSGCSNSPDEASEQINSNVISDEQENEVNSNDKTDKNQLPSFDSFEKDMNRIIADVLEPIGRGDEVEEWSVKKLYTYDQSAESEYDQMFLCEYGPDSIIKVSGMIIDGRIVQIKTLVSPALKKEEYSSEQVEYLALILMMPVSLYKDDYDFESLLKSMSDSGTWDEDDSGILGKVSENNISYELLIALDYMTSFTIEFENDVKIEEHEEKSIVAKKAEDTIIDTEYFTISIPSYWESDCVYEIKEGDCYNYTLSFYDRVSKENNYGGWLFSIELEPETEDYTIYPDYDVLGSLEVYRIGCYNIIVTYPTDVQCSEEDFGRYGLMEECIPGILKTISYKDECTFSSEPIPVYKNEESEQKIYGTFTGKWLDKGVGYDSPAPDEALSWNIEFKTNGTGTIFLIYENEDIIPVEFKYTRYDPFWGRFANPSDIPSMNDIDGITIELPNGNIYSYIINGYYWNNELQTMEMRMYAASNDGETRNDYISWVFVYEMSSSKEYYE